MLLRDMLKDVKDSKYAKTNDIGVKDDSQLDNRIETYEAQVKSAEEKGDHYLAEQLKEKITAIKNSEQYKTKDADDDIKKQIDDVNREIVDLQLGVQSKENVDKIKTLKQKRYDLVQQWDGRNGTRDAGKNGYVAFYNGKRVEVYADNKLDAQIEAAKQLGAKKHYDVAIELAEKDGEQVVHRAVDRGTGTKEEERLKQMKINMETARRQGDQDTVKEIKDAIDELEAKIKRETTEDAKDILTQDPKKTKDGVGKQVGSYRSYILYKSTKYSDDQFYGVNEQDDYIGGVSLEDVKKKIDAKKKTEDADYKGYEIDEQDKGVVVRKNGTSVDVVTSVEEAKKGIDAGKYNEKHGALGDTKDAISLQKGSKVKIAGVHFGGDNPIYEVIAKEGNQFRVKSPTGETFLVDPEEILSTADAKTKDDWSPEARKAAAEARKNSSSHKNEQAEAQRKDEEKYDKGAFNSTYFKSKEDRVTDSKTKDYEMESQYKGFKLVKMSSSLVALSPTGMVKYEVQSSGGVGSYTKEDVDKLKAQIDANETKDDYPAGGDAEENGDIIIKASEMSKYNELKAKGYTTAWVGEGKICLAPPKVTKDEDDIFKKRQIEIAKKTLRMPDAAAGVMGQSKEEAREILKKFGVPYDETKDASEIIVIDERYVGDKIIVMMQDTATSTMRSVTMSKEELKQYNRNKSEDIKKLWELAKTKDTLDNKIMHNYSGGYKTKDSTLPKVGEEYTYQGRRVVITKVEGNTFSFRGKEFGKTDHTMSLAEFASKNFYDPTRGVDDSNVKDDYPAGGDDEERYNEGKEYRQELEAEEKRSRKLDEEEAKKKLENKK